MVKTCSICKHSLPIGSFNKQTRAPDGLAYRCRDCDSVKKADHRLRHLEQLRAIDRARRSTPPRLALKRAWAKTEKGRICRRAASTVWREKNAWISACGRAVGRAVKSGALIRESCVVCGSTTVHAHHEDYFRPLEVTWLCPPHHKKWHAIHGLGLNHVGPGW